MCECLRQHGSWNLKKFFVVALEAILDDVLITQLYSLSTVVLVCCDTILLLTSATLHLGVFSEPQEEMAQSSVDLVNQRQPLIYTKWE